MFELLPMDPPVTQPQTVLTNADNPAVEAPIYIENVARTREHTYRALAADGLSRVPVPPRAIWNQISEIPLVAEPAQTINAGPEGVVERVAMVLRPVAGSNLKWEFASWVGNAPPTADIPFAITPSRSISPIRSPPSFERPCTGCRVRVVIGPRGR